MADLIRLRRYHCSLENHERQVYVMKHLVLKYRGACSTNRSNFLPVLGTPIIALPVGCCWIVYPEKVFYLCSGKHSVASTSHKRAKVSPYCKRKAYQVSKLDLLWVILELCRLCMTCIPRADLRASKALILSHFPQRCSFNYLR